jgi:Na+-transporting NADH:ubiquinone oxidoreductase subunit C
MLQKYTAKGGGTVSELQRKPATNMQTIVFMVVLSFVCALILSILASALAEPQAIAKELDRSKQMMIAAKLLDHEGHFLIHSAANSYQPAQYVEGGTLLPALASSAPVATSRQLLDVYAHRLQPLLVTADGQLTTFEDAGIEYKSYITDFRTAGYYKQPYKLIYKILQNLPDGQQKERTSIDHADGWVIPINGYGLWDAIYGYLALAPDGITVLGITWYDQKETPGLGANIADAPWQALFAGKRIFQGDPSGNIDLKTAPIGIAVVKGKVSEVLGSSPKAYSAVDGMAGATLTGNGVTDSYRDVLEAYRPFLLRLHENFAAEEHSQ